MRISAAEQDLSPCLKIPWNFIAIFMISIGNLEQGSSVAS